MYETYVIPGVPPEKKEPAGYANPPKSTRFQKGASGNPKGRPKKKDPDIMATLDRALLEKMPVRVNGRSKKLPVQEVLVMRMLEEAKKGDVNSTIKLIKFIAKYREDEANNWFKGLFNFAAKHDL